MRGLDISIYLADAIAQRQQHEIWHIVADTSGGRASSGQGSEAWMLSALNRYDLLQKIVCPCALHLSIGPTCGRTCMYLCVCEPVILLCTCGTSSDGLTSPFNLARALDVYYHSVYSERHITMSESRTILSPSTALIYAIMRSMFPLLPANMKLCHR